jgi:hypothetical protein
MDRREFARELVAGAMAGPVIRSGFDAASATFQEPTPPSLEDQLVDMLKAQFSDRLSDEQWKQVRGKINGQLTAAKTLREFKLQNSDEPATVFFAR